MNIAYLGFNSFKEFKRGVENVIDFQSRALEFENIFYVHWGDETTVYKNNKFACISIKHCWYWPVILNFILFRIKKDHKLLVHSHNPMFTLLSIIKTNILTVHDGLYYYNKHKSNHNLFLFKLAESLLYFRCTTVHFVSNYTKEKSLFGKRRNFVIIPNTSHFESILQKGGEEKPGLNMKSVLIVRSIEQRARFDLILKVAEELKQTDYLFSVAGKGPLLEYYQKEIIDRKLSNIKMLGYVNDSELLELYYKCDIVLVVAEWGEGFGLPIIEGYLFNKPVIASNVCAIPEIVISKDYLFNNNSESIINSLMQVQNIQRVNYYEYYKNKYSNSIVLSQFRELYLNNF